jgi:hypothetical protein
MTDQLGTPREGMMSATASLPLVVKPRFIKPVGERIKLQKVMLASFMTLQTIASPSSNAKPAYNITRTLLPTYDEVVNLTGLL